MLSSSIKPPTNVFLLVSLNSENTSLLHKLSRSLRLLDPSPDWSSSNSLSQVPSRPPNNTASKDCSPLLPLLLIKHPLQQSLKRKLEKQRLLRKKRNDHIAPFNFSTFFISIHMHTLIKIYYQSSSNTKNQPNQFGFQFGDYLQ